MNRFVAFVAVAAAFVSACTAPLGAQNGTRQTGATEARSVRGRVLHPDRVRGDSTGMAVTPDTWVTLHRVGRDDAGPIDSLRTDAQGRYRFRWVPQGATDAVYFASVNWDGIAYFTAPLRSVNTAGADAEITVFDTTSRTFPLSVRGRHLIVGAADSTNEHTVIEVFELSNDSVRALVAGEGENPAPTWSVSVPLAAKSATASEGDVSPDAFTFAPGRVSVFAPVAPGVKQVSFAYKIAGTQFPLTFTLDRGAVVFEVLLEDALGTLSGNGVTNVASVTLEGRNFRRYLGQDIKPGASVTVSLPGTGMSGRNLYIVGLLVAAGVLMVIVLSRAVSRRASAAALLGSAGGYREAQRPVAVPLQERIASEIAALDALHANDLAASPATSAEYDARRANLVKALSDELATGTS